MRVVLTASTVLLLLTIGCASAPQAPAKLAGSYAVQLDPALGDQRSVRGAPLLHQAVRDALEQRLQLAPNAAEAETVVLLKAARTPTTVDYEIRRKGHEIVSGEVPYGMITKDELSLREQQEALQREERARGDVGIQTRPIEPRATSTSPSHVEAVFLAGHRIADQIVGVLATRRASMN